ncbi:DoxX family protein [Amycolatopsis sp. NPDC059657]|uniref:DoxX family protein n=1 Tax=Amycolatopsis sp. NPDC059657 TaxID=3346899 RepID=UPI00366CCFC2
MPKPSPRVLDLIGTLVRVGLAAVWLVSGWLKISDAGQTFIAVKAYELLPDGLVGPVATMLPLLELVLGVMLLAGFGTRLAGIGSIVLLLLLIAVIAQSWARGLTIDCGCFGGGGQVAAGQTQYPQEIARDTGFLLLAVWLTLRPSTLFSVDGWLGWNSKAVPDDSFDETASSERT